jgi:hypothetical protein
LRTEFLAQRTGMLPGLLAKRADHESQTNADQNRRPKVETEEIADDADAQSGNGLSEPAPI